jgi:imidazolonepropionase-like amidohydrolase
MKEESVFTLSNARILVGDGTELKGGLRVRNGVIEAVGPELTDGQDLHGQLLWPGVFNGGSCLGLYEIDQEAPTHDETEGSDAVLPQARVLDAYNPRSAAIPVTRLGGVTGNLVVPGGGRLISGQAAWVRTAGNTVEEALIAAPAGLCINLGKAGTSDGGPKGRMGVALQLRDLFEANKPEEPVESKKKKKESEAKEPETESARVVQKLLKRELKALIFAERASDILVGLELIKSFDLDAILVGCTEGHLVAGELAEAKIPLLLGPVNAQPSSYDTLYATCENPRLLHKAGVRFAFRNPAVHNLREAPVVAGLAVAYGLPWEAAIAAACGNGPEFFGLKVGQIKAGYEATFAISDGDPLQARSKVTGLLYQGRFEPLVSRQTELRDRFSTISPESQAPAARQGLGSPR